jgi:hypothetical protein
MTFITPPPSPRGSVSTPDRREPPVSRIPTGVTRPYMLSTPIGTLPIRDPAPIPPGFFRPPVMSPPTTPDQPIRNATLIPSVASPPMTPDQKIPDAPHTPPGVTRQRTVGIPATMGTTRTDLIGTYDFLNRPGAAL